MFRRLIMVIFRLYMKYFVAVTQNIHGLFISGREGVKWARDIVSVGKVVLCGLLERSMLLPSYVYAYYS